MITKIRGSHGFFPSSNKTIVVDHHGLQVIDKSGKVVDEFSFDKVRIACCAHWQLGMSESKLDLELRDAEGAILPYDGPEVGWWQVRRTQASFLVENFKLPDVQKLRAAITAVRPDIIILEQNFGMLTRQEISEAIAKCKQMRR